MKNLKLKYITFEPPSDEYDGYIEVDARDMWILPSEIPKLKAWVYQLPYCEHDFRPIDGGEVKCIKCNKMERGA